jgi:Protein kinase domain
VLYFHHGNTWKLTDFGTSGPALTKGFTTKGLRGTDCYRAPELYKWQAKFTPMVDLWALGCILYECLTGSKAFEFHTLLLTYSDDIIPTLRLPWPSVIWHNLLGSVVCDLLCEDKDHRPTASETLDLFMSFDRILTASFSELVFNCEYGVSFELWKRLRLNFSSDIEWMYEFANNYRSQGQEATANAIVDEMTDLYLHTIWSLHGLNAGRRIGNVDLSHAAYFKDDPNLEVALVWFKRLVDHLPMQLLAWICFELAVYLVSKEKPDLNTAISICNIGLEHSPRNIVISMLLSNLYAETGSYMDATQIKEHVFNACTENDLIALESELFRFLPYISGPGSSVQDGLVDLLHS